MGIIPLTEGNELADMLAKEAGTMQKVNYTKTPISHIKQELGIKTIPEWNKLWITSRNGSQTRAFFKTIEEKEEKKNQL
ncbi:hypothetical protein LAZ67_3005473 [Cordylochernes scorpioides]|uniref:Uncharacterized protein n=1 Tax=Cordylochernes scorpioides TaxID=51811 RepID=A0ABY6KDH2_9ARAC|nr:hypothetical protein LAZ67_3005473 [Cordylochernes scorpioides]